MPRAYDPGPLAKAVTEFNQEHNFTDLEIRKSIQVATGLDSRLIKGMMKEENQLTEKTIDIICCNYLRVHPWTVYGDWYFGDRVEKYMAQLDEQYGTSISTYCPHEWETLLSTEIPEFDETPLVRKLMGDGLISIVYCGNCQRFSHSLQNPLKQCG